MKKYRSSKYVNFKYAQGKTDIYGRMFHDCYEIYLLLNGEVEYINNHMRQMLKPYQLVIIPPGEYHQFVVAGDVDSYERCVIDVYPELLEADALKAAFAGKELLSPDKSDRIIKNFLYLTECISDVNEADFSYILPAITTDIIFLIKNNPNNGMLSHGSLCPLSLDVMRYIDEHYTEPLDLNQLSDKFHFSVSSLCHIFKKDFGISIKKYILQKRMNASNLALQNGDKPEEVSIRYGFLNYSTFYRAYKQYFKASPSETFKRK